MAVERIVPIVDNELEVEESVVLAAMQEFEGFTVEEAALTYKQRENLPNTAFCGPSRTYPAHDAKRVRAGLQRLSQFGGRLKPAVRNSIFNCLKRRAKRMGITISDDVLRKFKKRVVSETEQKEEILQWYLEKVYPLYKK